MPNPQESANFPRLISRNAADGAISRALSLFIGRGRQFSVKEASNGSGVPDRLIECAKCDPDSTDFRPLSNGDLLSLSLFLGPEFSSQWMKLAKQGAFWLPDSGDTPPGALAADLSEDTAKVTRLAADGSFDGDGEHLTPVGLRLIVAGQQLVGLGAVA